MLHARHIHHKDRKTAKMQLGGNISVAVCSLRDLCQIGFVLLGFSRWLFFDLYPLLRR